MSRLRWLVVLGALLGAVLVEYEEGWLLAWRFQPTPELAPHAPPRDLAEARRQDLADLAEFARLDRSLSSAARAAFEARVAGLSQRAGDLDDGAFAAEVARAVALADNGHSKAWPRRAPRAPLRLAWFAEGLFVVRATVEHAELLGARVASLQGRSPEAALSALARVVGGTPERVRTQAAYLFAIPALLHGLWPDAPADALVLSLEGRDGTRIERRLAAGGVGDSPSGAELAPLLAPAPAAQGPSEWRYALGGAALPPSLRDAGHALYWERLDPGTLYVRLNAIQDDERGPLDAQLAALTARVAEPPPRRILLDLRFDEGGDYMKTLAFTRALPRALAPHGSLWLLTSNETFSAAIVTLARVKAFAGERAHVAGEPVGDRETFWAERGEPLVLRNSGIEVSYATGMHDWVRGCWNPLRCYWPNLVHGVAAGDLAPELRASWRYVDYAAGRDSVLERVLAADAGGAQPALATE